MQKTVSFCSLSHFPVISTIWWFFCFLFFFFSSRRRHTRSLCDWSSDVCSSDLCAKDCSESGRVVDTVAGTQEDRIIIPTINTKGGSKLLPRKPVMQVHFIITFPFHQEVFYTLGKMIKEACRNIDSRVGTVATYRVIDSDAMRWSPLVAFRASNPLALALREPYEVGRVPLPPLAFFTGARTVSRAEIVFISGDRSIRSRCSPSEPKVIF